MWRGREYKKQVNLYISWHVSTREREGDRESEKEGECSRNKLTYLVGSCVYLLG